jgi:hypothetical protein
MGLNNELEGYSHPQYTMLHECLYNKVAVAATATTYGHFRSRNKVIVRAIHFALRSNCSSTSGTLKAMRSTASIGFAITPSHVSTGGAEYVTTITLTSSNTLNTITEYMGFQAQGGLNLGKWDVLYEYDVVYPATKIGA